jgi:GABA(A) receptor-associated protein
MGIAHKLKSFEQRKKESDEILHKYSDRICVYLEKQESCDTLPPLDKNKYLVPNGISVGQFIYVIRKRISLTKEQAIFLFANSTVLSGTTRMIEINDKHKNNDGFLYLKYAGENCFG